MPKSITRIVLTGGPAAGKTTLISRILKEFKQEDGWRVITIPETATDLISGFGIKPFGNCVSMLDFQYFVIEDQLHKERLALKAARMVPEEKVLVIYDRALLDDKAYITDDEFTDILTSFGKTEEQVLSGYDAVLHLVTCAKGAEFAYNYGNAARYESVEVAREKDDKTLRAWSRHPALHVIDNSVNFEDKINRGIAAIFSIIGQPAPAQSKRKYLIAMPDTAELVRRYNAACVRYFLVKPSDVAIYVEHGAADIGIVGKDILTESGADVYELLDTGMGKCRMCVAGPAGFTDDESRALRVATKFVNIARDHYERRGRDIYIVKLNGSIELAPILGLSDVIVDIVETGTTLKENDLTVIEEFMPISARFIANKASYKFKYAQLTELLNKMKEALAK